MINVVNKYTHTLTPDDILICRGTPLGNPYTSIQYRETKAQFVCATREESLGSFNTYILERIAQKDKKICDELNRIWKIVKNGGTVNLVCYCTPKPCHGNILKKIIESKLK